MGRMIDADTLTAIIKKYKKLTEEMKGLSTAGYKLALDHIEEVVELLKIYTSEICNNWWIPCEVRLPEDNQDVLICHSDNTISIDRFINKYIGFEVDIYKDIIAWQSLPAPYKKGE